MDSLQDYQKVEHQNRQKYRDRMERQYKIGMSYKVRLIPLNVMIFELKIQLLHECTFLGNMYLKRMCTIENK